MQQRTHQSRDPSHEAELRRSLNASAGDATVVRAFCFELPVANADGAPEWIPYLPAPDANGKLVGEDGRAWMLKDARALAAKVKRKLPLDINHSNDLAAKSGGESPAVGWLTEFQVRDDGSLWAKTNWNPRGLNAVQNREYGFISPAFDHDKGGNIVRLAGASLVNEPNFTTLALNRAGSAEDHTMTLEQLLALLGLASTATAEEAQRAINALKNEHQRALNAAESPDLTRFVPRADYDAAVTRATNAEQSVKDSEAKKLDADIEVAVTDALKAGKITPATADYHRAMCKQEGGLEKFRAYVSATPVVVSPEELAKQPVDVNGKTVLTENQRAICRNLGMAEADYIKSLPAAQ